MELAPQPARLLLPPFRKPAELKRTANQPYLYFVDPPRSYSEAERWIGIKTKSVSILSL